MKDLLADGTDLSPGIDQFKGGNALGFRHAVALGEVHRLFFLVFTEQRNRHRRTACHKKMHMGKVSLLPGRGLGQHLEHDRHTKDISNPLLGNKVEDFGRIIEVSQNQGAAGINHLHRRCSQSADMEKRRQDKGDGCGADTVTEHSMHCAKEKIFMG